jgi:hypothetical protein
MQWCSPHFLINYQRQKFPQEFQSAEIFQCSPHEWCLDYPWGFYVTSISKKYLQERISLPQFKMWHRYTKLLHLWWKMSTRLTLFNVICYLYWQCRTWDLGQERGGISTSRVPMSAPNMRRFRFARLGSFVFGKILGNGSASSVPCSCKSMSNIVTFDDRSIQINWIGLQFKENLLRTGFLILLYYVFIFLKGKIKSSIQGGFHV